jgi:hypothetical protein
MAAAIKHAGLELEGRHHSGADDAWNIAALILEIVVRGGWPTAEQLVPDESTWQTRPARFCGAQSG